MACAVVNGAASPMHLLQRELMPLELFFYEMNDHPAELARCSESIGRYFERVFEVVLKCPADLFFLGANYDTSVTYPAFFREHIQPWLRRFAARLHAKGKFLLTHTDGENTGLLDCYLDSAIDVADSVCPCADDQALVSAGARPFRRPDYDHGRNSLDQSAEDLDVGPGVRDLSGRLLLEPRLGRSSDPGHLRHHPARRGVRAHRAHRRLCPAPSDPCGRVRQSVFELVMAAGHAEGLPALCAAGRTWAHPLTENRLTHFLTGNSPENHPRQLLLTRGIRMLRMRHLMADRRVERGHMANSGEAMPPQSVTLR